MAAAKPTAVDGTAPSGDNVADIALLTSILTQQSSESDAVSLNEIDIAEELRRLEAAHGIAEGMEDRLDGLIGNLDKLLESLQGDVDTAEQETSSASTVSEQPQNSQNSITGSHTTDAAR
ncbi:hypothetical protein EUX98_g2254 [Antrodiella citrinella]|uniref:Uncharacterized protein n=1 Tax=Antrodiella citrinella TaxID=2447956 RepID=A0A4S4MZI3_9APHY|nr:hypothetical protein EUX98_g2254 [Antrodiella citrinella]